MIMIMLNILLLKNLISENSALILAQTNLASKNDAANFVKKKQILMIN